MADSRRQRLIDEIIARMMLIDGTGDFVTNVEGRVKDNETTWAQDQQTLPAISVFDGDAIGNPTSKGEPLGTIHEMAVLIKYFDVRGTDAANARNGIKDILTAIRLDDKWHVAGVPLAMQSREVVNRIYRNPESFEVEGAEVEIGIQFKTAKFNAE